VIATVQLSDQQHLVLHGMPWSFYEDVLASDRPLRITFDEGNIEMMAPLPEHEAPREAIGALIDVLVIERGIPSARFGSTTFRREDRRKGLEPDKCYYFANSSAVRGMKQFDSTVHPPPDLAIEIDITSRSVPREPVYAGLGIPELWRCDGENPIVLLLDPTGKYIESSTSQVFPFLPMTRFEEFVRRMEREEQTMVLREFRDWVQTLPVG
jgi:Uma2 family endonuclease